MADIFHGKRQSPRSKAAQRDAARDTVGYHPSELDTRYQGAGVVPGAHPEYATPVPFGNPFKQIGGAIKAVMNYGKKRPK